MSGENLQSVLCSVSERIAHCRNAPVDQAKEAFGAAMVRLIEARNARLAAVDATDPELQQLNAILSLMASIEFPLAGLHRERMDQVTRALDALASAAA